MYLYEFNRHLLEEGGHSTQNIAYCSFNLVVGRKILLEIMSD
jgi:hypothetical protein